MLHAAGERLGGPPEHVVVTHPANWGLFKIQLMRNIVATAGIPTAELCPEPVAAAIEYAAKQRVPVGAKLAMYDLGGGTFDVAVLEKTDLGFEIVGMPIGVDHLGGSDFDQAVLADAATKLGLHGLDPEDPATARGSPLCIGTASRPRKPCPVMSPPMSALPAARCRSVRPPDPPRARRS